MGWLAFLQETWRRLYVGPYDNEIAQIRSSDPLAYAAAQQALAACSRQGATQAPAPLPAMHAAPPRASPALRQQQHQLLQPPAPAPQQPLQVVRLAPVSVRGAWQLVSTEVAVQGVPPGPEARQLGEVERLCESVGCMGEPLPVLLHVLLLPSLPVLLPLPLPPLHCF